VIMSEPEAPPTGEIRRRSPNRSVWAARAATIRVMMAATDRQVIRSSAAITTNAA
jgi:hypothetical protein